MKKRLEIKLCNLINRETLLYTVFGVLTSILNIILFQVLVTINFDYKIANFVTLIIVKIVAYICNKNIVFKSKCENLGELLKEILRFIVARGATMIIDYLGLIILVEYIQIDKFISKCFVTVFVIILNYVIGKKHVFKNLPNN